eukprot:scaffold106305_cov70-Phaeocystis_antarctica.AAC.5
MRLQVVLLLCGASVSALRQPIGRITSLNRNRLVADEADSLFYRSPRLVNHADGVLAAPRAATRAAPALQPALHPRCTRTMALLTTACRTTALPTNNYGSPHCSSSTPTVLADPGPDPGPG